MKKSRTKENPMVSSGASEAAPVYTGHTPAHFMPAFHNFNRMEVFNLIERGIPFSTFERIKKDIPLTEEQWAEMLDISIRTFSRYKIENSTFKAIHSEKIVEIAEVMEAGMKYFGRYEMLKRWLETPNPALGNRMPVSLLKNSYGKEMVLLELHRISSAIFV